MDAVSFDYMYSEYQEKQKDAAEASSPREEVSPPPPAPPPDQELGYDYEAEVGSSETLLAVELSQDEPDVSVLPSGVVPRTSGSTSSSNASIQESNSIGSSTPSFYVPSIMSPTVNYERDFPDQKLVAVFGRQFDRPDVVANKLQKLVAEQSSRDTPNPSAKFVPFTMKRKSLLKGSYSSSELKKHNLICMCYNASEARIMLTGVDGFYSSLLKHTEAILGL